jgi:hypothetical protein
MTRDFRTVCCEVRGSVLTEEQCREVVRLYVEEHESAPTIGRRMYCHERTIRRVLEARGVPRRPSSIPSPPPSQDLIDRAVELYLSGHSMNEAVEIMGVSYCTVRNSLRLADVAARERPQSAALHYRSRLSQDAGITDRQRAALKFVETDAFDSDQPTTTPRVARAIGTTTRYARRTLLQLEHYGLLKSRRTVESSGRHFIWERTGLPVRDVVIHTLAPPPQRRSNEVWLPIEPLRAWLERQIDAEQRLMLHISTDEDNGIAPTPGAARVATRLHLDHRRLYALRFEQRQRHPLNGRPVPPPCGGRDDARGLVA